MLQLLPILPTEELERSESSESRRKSEGIFLNFFQDHRLIAMLCTFLFPVGVLAAQVCYVYAILKGDKARMKQLDFIITRLRGFEAVFESGPVGTSNLQNCLHSDMDRDTDRLHLVFFPDLGQHINSLGSILLTSEGYQNKSFEPCSYPPSVSHLSCLQTWIPHLHNCLHETLCIHSMCPQFSA